MVSTIQNSGPLYAAKLSAALITASFLCGPLRAAGPIERSLRIRLPGKPAALALSADGGTLVTATERSVIWFDAVSGDERGRADASQDVVAVDVSRDGSTIAAAVDSPLIAVLDSASGKLVEKIHRRDGPSFLRADKQIAFGLFRDGSKLVSTGSSRRIYLSDVSSGEWDLIMFIKYNRARPVVSSDDQFVALIGSPNAREISGHVTVYKVRRGLQPLWTRWHNDSEPTVWAQFSEDSSRLVTTGGDGIRVWDVESGSLLAFIPSDDERPILGACSHAQHIVSLSSNRFDIYRIATDSQRLLGSVPLEGIASGFATSTDGARLVTWTDEGFIDVWSVDISNLTSPE